MPQFLQQGDNFTGEKATAPRCSVSRGGLRFGDSEEEDCAKGEQNKEREGENVDEQGRNKEKE